MYKKRFVSFCALLLALALVFSNVPVLAENNAFVKITDAGRINLRSGPAANYRRLASIEPGTPLEVLSVTGKWAHVLVANPDGGGKLEGYMYTDYIEYTTYDPHPSYPTEVVYDWQSVGNQNNYPPITENTAMYVNTGNPGRLHLREYASQNARSLGLFPNGTKVTVLNRSSGWAFVYVNQMYGYMMLTYLSTSPNTPVQPVNPPASGVKKYVNTGNSGRLHLREYASQNARSLGLFSNGTVVTATDLGNGWSYVSVSGMTGYMMSKFLSNTPPYIPDPYNPGKYSIMYVYSPNGSNVDLYASMSVYAQSLGKYANGTAVRVYKYDGSWALVIVDGKTGYMQTTRLSYSPYTPPHPVNPIGVATVVHPNGSFVYLRSTRSTASMDNILAKVPSGTRVNVYEQDEWYSLIEYNGMYGYMVSHFLQYGSKPVPSPTPAGRTVVRMIVGGTALRSTREEGNANNVIMQLTHGTMVEILLTYPDEWRYVDYNGIRGYIHGPVVATVPTSAPTSPVGPVGPVLFTAVVRHPNGSFVYLRSSRSTGSLDNVLAKVPSGSVVKVYQYDEWYSLVEYNGMKGYMVSSYLNRNVGGSAPSEETSVEKILYRAAAEQNVKMYSDANSNSQVLNSLQKGTVVDVYEERNNWLKVVYKGQQGFVQRSCFKKVSLAQSTSPAPQSIPSIPLMPAQPNATDAPQSIPAIPLMPAQPSTAAAPQSIPAIPLMPAQPNKTDAPQSIPAIPLMPAQPNKTDAPQSIPATSLTPAQPQNPSVGEEASYEKRRVEGNEDGPFAYLRSSKDATTQKNIIGKISNGTIVEVMIMSKTWTKVRVSGKVGYMLSKYLK